MMTLMARHILHETVTRARWLSVAVGFLGVLCASDPFGLYRMAGHRETPERDGATCSGGGP